MQQAHRFCKSGGEGIIELLVKIIRKKPISFTNFCILAKEIGFCLWQFLVEISGVKAPPSQSRFPLAESFPKSMVKRKALEKLSNIELEKYIKPESRFVADAIEIAYEILKSRGRTFTEKENEQIQSLIQTKKDSEPKYDEIKNNGWDKNYTEDENAIELYTNKLIWIYCLLVGVIFGSFLQVYNFIKLKKTKAAIITLVFGILYSTLQVIIMNYVGDVEYGRYSLRIFLSGLGALGLIAIKENLFKDSTEYRAKSITIPVIIAVLIHIYLIYTIFFES